MTTTSSVEVWKDIPGFEGAYQASTLGRVRSVDRIHEIFKNGTLQLRNDKGRVLSQSKSSNGFYRQVTLSVGSKPQKWLVHRLIAITFIEQPDPAKTEVNHKDCNGSNNSVSNLEWITPEDNKIHAFKNGRNDFRRKARATSSSGYAGVAKYRNKWQASITYKGERTYLGVFATIDEAVKARRAAEAHYENTVICGY